MDSSRSRPWSSRFEHKAADGSRAHLGNEALKSGYEVTPGQSSSVGVPRRLDPNRMSDGATGASEYDGWNGVSLPECLEDLIDL